MAAPGLLGRSEELAALTQLIERASEGPAGLVFEGEAGIGKTTLWRTGIALARESGFRVLSCEPAPTEARLAFAGLGDLFDDIPLEMLERLPPPQRSALAVSLLLVEPSGERIDQHAVALAVMALIRTVAMGSPALIAIDDVQWLDSSSAQVLAFALRRLHEGRIGLLVTRRTGEGPYEEFPLGLGHSDELSQAIEQRTLGPLSFGAIGRLVRERTGRRLPRPVLSQLFRAADGNPFFALELARYEIERPSAGDEPIRVPEHLRAIVYDRLASLQHVTRETLLIAATASEPTEDLVAAAGGGDLNEAVDAGVVEVEGGRVRFCHPLHASVLYERAAPGRRRELHKRLAEIVASSEERARHLALGSEGPDEEIAAELEKAARGAAARGALAAAAELYEHATRLTPPGETELERRSIETITYYFGTGDVERARELAESMLAQTEKSSLRVDLLVLLADMVEDQLEAVDLCRQAVEAAGDDQLRLGRANIALARASSVLGDFPGQVEAQRLALVHAEQAGDSALLVEALQGVGNVEVLGGGPINEEVMQRAIEIERGELELTPVRRPTFWHGMQLAWTGELERGREIIAGELERAEREGELIDRLHILAPLIEIVTRLGEWDLAEQMANEGLEQAFDTGHRYLIRQIAFRRLELKVLRGQVEESRRGFGELTAQAEKAHVRSPRLMLQALEGFLELSLGDVRACWERLESAIRLETELGPDTFLAIPLLGLYPNAIESLVTLGELEKAGKLLEPLKARAARTSRPSVIVGAARSRALVSAGSGDLQAAREALEGAISAQEKLPEPFERGRTMLVAGAIERRRKQKADARRDLEEAISIFKRLGARLWLDKAETELRRVTGARAGNLELTPTEFQIAELVADGRSNKEIAAQLFLSVRTVETNLSNIYRKLDVDSRTDLGNWLKSNRASSPETLPSDVSAD